MHKKRIKNYCGANYIHSVQPVYWRLEWALNLLIRQFGSVGLMLSERWIQWQYLWTVISGDVHSQSQSQHSTVCSVHFSLFSFLSQSKQIVHIPANSFGSDRKMAYSRLRFTSDGEMNWFMVLFAFTCRTPINLVQTAFLLALDSQLRFEQKYLLRFFFVTPLLGLN